jgi:hypothetical protein
MNRWSFGEPQQFCHPESAAFFLASRDEMPSLNSQNPTLNVQMRIHLQRQLSVALENQPGRLAAISGALAEQRIHIEALCVIDNVEQGMVRMTMSDPVLARSVLERAGLHVIEAEVLALELTDRLGKLAAISRALGDAGINIEYAYASVDHAGARTRMILKTSQPRHASEILGKLSNH